jgi:hypothetical protein
VQTALFVGDHPAHSVVETTYNGDLFDGEMYVKIDDDRWASVFPFVVAQKCSKCQMQESYFTDRWSGPTAQAQMKSFERGHEVTSEAVGVALGEWLESGIS